MGLILFTDHQKDTFSKLVDAVIPSPADRRVTPEQLSDRFEEFINLADGVPQNLIRTALDIISPILSVTDIASPGDLRGDVRARLSDALTSESDIARNAARLLHILITYLYYSDPRVDSQVGYIRFKERNRPQAKMAAGPSRIDVQHTISTKDYDVCIVGSGIAGSLLANRLSKKGKSVLVLEAGRYYPEGKLSDDEFLMLAQLYKAEVFQSALGNSFPVIQAQCVGGGAVVNNAVCFRMPDWVKKEWDDFGAQLDDARLKAAFDKTQEELKIRPADKIVQKNGRPYLNPSRDFFLRGVKSLGIPHGTGDPQKIEEGFHTVCVNIEDCLGCGYCNLGCSYERKINTLHKLLPEALATGNCDVVAQARVEKVSTSLQTIGHLKVDGLQVRLQSGEVVNVKAKKYILSAGAIASSAILLKSFKVRLLGTPIGERFSANAGTPLEAKFNEPVNSYDGLQISDYFVEKNTDGTWDWIGEIWFNPPGTQAQAIPGYLDTHFKRMKDYPFYAGMGPLVGTEAVGKIELNLLNQPEAKLTLPTTDLKKLKKGLRRMAEVFFAGGAEEIYIMTRKEMILRSKKELSRIDKEITKPEDFLMISTGHPQGGNSMSDEKTKGKYRGVVGTNFKVHGVEDLFVCDASVFPTSVKVNPQWTVLALADLCAVEVLQEL